MGKKDRKATDTVEMTEKGELEVKARARAALVHGHIKPVGRRAGTQRRRKKG